MATTINPTEGIDHTLTAKENIVKLVNDANGDSFTVDDMTLSAPSQPDSENLEYTQLTLTAAANSDYTGGVDIHYNRLDLAQIVANHSGQVDLTGQNPTASNITQLVSTALNLIENDLQLETSDYSGGAGTIDLSVSSDSLLYFGTATLDIVA